MDCTKRGPPTQMPIPLQEVEWLDGGWGRWGKKRERKGLTRRPFLARFEWEPWWLLSREEQREKGS